MNTGAIIFKIGILIWTLVVLCMCFFLVRAGDYDYAVLFGGVFFVNLAIYRDIEVES